MDRQTHVERLNLLIVSQPFC